MIIHEFLINLSPQIWNSSFSWPDLVYGQNNFLSNVKFAVFSLYFYLYRTHIALKEVSYLQYQLQWLETA